MSTPFPSGFLIVDKPAGVTSFSMVALIRRLTGVRRVGHAGTLDPLATGVLPIAIGHATRFIEYLDDVPKTYEATVRFGIETNTYDVEGEVTATADPSAITRGAVEALLPRFTGDIDQVPPAHSAIKLAGKPLYRYAREGIALDLQPRRVHVDHIELRSFEPGATSTAGIQVTCGKGTYIRSLAHDIGRMLGCGAHLTGLCRTSTGGFGIRLARTPDELATLAEQEQLASVTLAIDRAVERRYAAILAERHAIDVSAGRSVALDLLPEVDAIQPDEICRAYDASGSFLAVLQAQLDGSWHPAKVLPTL